MAKHINYWLEKGVALEEANLRTTGFRTCNGCAIIFEIKVRGTSEYCSSECKQHTENNIEYNCVGCNKLIRKIDSYRRTKIVCSKVCNNKIVNKRISPITVEYWTQKGLSVNEASIKIVQEQRRRSPRCEEHWIDKGLTNPIEIQQSISNWQSMICAMDNSTTEERQLRNKRSLKYWLNQGLPKEYALEEQRKFNDNVSLDSFVRRFG
jgi:hypothetical protein